MTLFVPSDMNLMPFGAKGLSKIKIVNTVKQIAKLYLPSALNSCHNDGFAFGCFQISPSDHWV